MAAVTILVRYHGVVRLLLGRREDFFKFAAAPTVSEVVAAIAAKHGTAAAAACRRQAFARYQPGGAAGHYAGLDETLADGDTLIIISPLTGG